MTLVPLAPPARLKTEAPAGTARAPARGGLHWYQKKRYILPLGLLLSAVLGTAAGGLRDEASSQPTENPAGQVVVVDAGPASR